MTSFTVMQSPLASLGPLTLTAEGDALTGIWFDAHDIKPAARAQWVQDDALEILQQTRQQLTEYFAGQRQQFDLNLQPKGTEFQRAVWQQLLGVDFGKTSTYGTLAQAIGKPNASRAVGAAVGANPLSIIVPCHRIIGRNGSLTGYAGGLARKVTLLKLEGQTDAQLTAVPTLTRPAPEVHNSRNEFAPAH